MAFAFHNQSVSGVSTLGRVQRTIGAAMRRIRKNHAYGLDSATAERLETLAETAPHLMSDIGFRPDGKGGWVRAGLRVAPCDAERGDGMTRAGRV